MDSSANVNEGCIAVRNDYQWMGNQQAAQFAVYLDGRFSGWVPLGQWVNLPVDHGKHTLRVRMWYYFSRRVTVSIAPGETKRFSADIPRAMPFLARMMRGIFDPFHWLSLAEIGDRSSPENRP